MIDRDVEALLAWYSRVRRPLPWRFTREPYAILVSEVMLQQTQAVRVVGYFERWMTRFPDPDALAAAPVAAIDTNVRRVLERHDGRRRTAAELRRRATGLLPARRVGDFNQAMMELGATVCRARRPTCGGCPVRAGCASAGLAPAPPRRTVRGEDGGLVPEVRGSGRSPVSGGVPKVRGSGWLIGGEDTRRAPVARNPPRRRVRFEDTDRWARGRILAALLAGHPPPPLDAARLERALAGLERDGLIARGSDGGPRLR